MLIKFISKCEMGERQWKRGHWLIEKGINGKSEVCESGREKSKRVVKCIAKRKVSEGMGESIDWLVEIDTKF